MAGKNKSGPLIAFAGIRHHGPGTSKALQSWLTQLKPDIILLECPSDAKNALDLLELAEIKPPLALAIYPEVAVHETILLPFANFSPEWIAISHAKENDIDLIPIDLPSFAWNRDEFKKMQCNSNQEALQSAFEAAGIEDQEKWWDSSIEEGNAGAEIFAHIAELMENWRQLESGNNPLNELREAFMRTEILRISKKNKTKTIAIVTGAYHLPAIRDFEGKINDDAVTNKNIKKQKTKAVWIPWSYQRLASFTGYGAGVKYPSWYEHLYDHGFNKPQIWLTKVAQLLRSKGVPISTAEVLDSIELCSELVKIKGINDPSLSDLKTAVISAMLSGKSAYWEIIEDELLIGRSFGDLGRLNEAHPIKLDFDQKIKKFRLTAFLKRKESKSRKLDLRKETHLEMSFFLHRLNLLNIYLGTIDYSEQSDHSNFSESWLLEWSEDNEITLIQAGVYGNTVEEATENLLEEKLQKEQSLANISEWMLKLLLAGMPSLVSKSLNILNDLAFISLDNTQLITLCRQLLLGSKYGNIRKYPSEELLSLLEELLPRVFGIFPSQCFHVNEKKARQALADLILLKNVSGILNNSEVNEMWRNLLLHLHQSEFIHPLVQGAVLRQLTDNGLLDQDGASKRISLALSGTLEPLDKSLWLEGLLSFGMLGLLYTPDTTELLDNFVDQLTEEAYRSVLPALKRSFSNLSKTEKQRLFHHLSFEEKDIKNQEEGKLERLNIEKTTSEVPELVRMILS